MLRGVGDDGKHVTDVCDRDVVVEQVAHRIDENRPWLPPTSRLVQRVGVECEPEPRATSPRITVVLVLPGAHRLQPLGEGQGVTVVAARGCAVAPGRGIPRRFSPLDWRSITHPSSSLAWRECRRRVARMFDDIGGASLVQRWSRRIPFREMKCPHQRSCRERVLTRSKYPVVDSLSHTRVLRDP